MINRKAFILSLFSFVLALSACATSGPTATAEEKATKPKVYVAPIQISKELATRQKTLKRHDDERPVTLRDLKTQAAKLRTDIKTRISETHRLASSPGEGVIVVETTLTELKANKPTLADYDRKPGLSFRSIYSGGAKADFVISQDGSQVNSFSESYRGDLSDNIRRESIWGDARFAFRRFAAKVTQTLQ